MTFLIGQSDEVVASAKSAESLRLMAVGNSKVLQLLHYAWLRWSWVSISKGKRIRCMDPVIADILFFRD